MGKQVGWFVVYDQFKGVYYKPNKRRYPHLIAFRPRKMMLYIIHILYVEQHIIVYNGVVLMSSSSNESFLIAPSRMDGEDVGGHVSGNI